MSDRLTAVLNEIADTAKVVIVAGWGDLAERKLERGQHSEPITLVDFFRVNDELDPDLVRASLAEHAEARIGGGAAAAVTLKLLRENCPTCGEVVLTIFDHVDQDCEHP